MAQERTQQNDTIDSICWRYYGRTAGVTELVLQANPTLAELGPIIPMGTLITLPDAPPAAPKKESINLWT